jgi:hypothetical protein
MNPNAMTKELQHIDPEDINDFLDKVEISFDIKFEDIELRHNLT